jgi:hypothetical protein
MEELIKKQKRFSWIIAALAILLAAVIVFLIITSL